MSGPTRQQLVLLKAIQNQAVAAKKMKDHARARHEATGEQASPSWFDTFRAHAMLRQELDNAALAAGIAPVWIEQSRKAGELGMRWSKGRHWREPAPVQREKLLADLETQARQVQDMAAVAARFGERGRQAEVGTARLFDRKLRILAQRVTAVAAVLEVTAAEAERLWGEPSWARAARSVRDASAEVLARRWRGHVRADTRSLELQAKALADCGAARTDEPLSVPSMLARIHAHLASQSSPPPEVTGAGPQIAAAIDVAGMSEHTATQFEPAVGMPQFSSPASTSGVEP